MNERELFLQAVDIADALLELGESPEQIQFNPTIRELLDRAAAELAEDKIEASFPGQTLLQAELLSTVSRIVLAGQAINEVDSFVRRSFEHQ